MTETASNNILLIHGNLGKYSGALRYAIERAEEAKMSRALIAEAVGVPRRVLDEMIRAWR